MRMTNREAHAIVLIASVVVIIVAGFGVASLITLL